MLVLIDESGDCGLKFGKGSSDFFTCVAVVFTDNFCASACDRTIDQIRASLKRPHAFEFHFTDCSNKVRTAFLEGISQEEFRYAGFVVDKRKLYGSRFSDPKSFYEFAVGIVCENIKPLLSDAKIIIDKNGDRNFKNRLEQVLKQQMTLQDGTCLIKKVTMERSHSNNLVQLADMICGAVGRSFTGQDDLFRSIVRKRERSVQLWPK